MKLGSTATLTFGLLTLMFGAGLVGGILGFTWGREALKGVSQPDANPTLRLTGYSRQAPRPEAFSFAKEDQILASIAALKKRVNAAYQKNQADAEAKGIGDRNLATTAPGALKSSSGQLLMTSDEKVTLEIQSIERQGRVLLLGVSLRNDGSQPVRFLYSFLNITDDQGQTLSASTEGLPQEIPPSGRTFPGLIRVPVALLNEAETLSLSLTDYPDQRLQLQISGIPVVKSVP